MIPAVPKRNKHYLSNGSYYEVNSNNISFILEGNLPISEFESSILKERKMNVVIQGNPSVTFLNQLFSTMAKYSNINITILAHSFRSLYPSDKLNLNDIPKNITINYQFSKCNNEFSIWAHNLSNEEKSLLCTRLDSVSYNQFIETEGIISRFARDVRIMDISSSGLYVSKSPNLLEFL